MFVKNGNLTKTAVTFSKLRTSYRYKLINHLKIIRYENFKINCLRPAFFSRNWHR